MEVARRVKICTLEPGGIRPKHGHGVPVKMPGGAAGLRGLGRFDAQDIAKLEGRAEGDPRKIADVILQLAK